MQCFPTLNCFFFIVYHNFVNFPYHSPQCFVLDFLWKFLSSELTMNLFLKHGHKMPPTKQNLLFTNKKHPVSLSSLTKETTEKKSSTRQNLYRKIILNCKYEAEHEGWVENWESQLWGCCLNHVQSLCFIPFVLTVLMAI